MVVEQKAQDYFLGKMWYKQYQAKLNEDINEKFIQEQTQFFSQVLYTLACYPVKHNIFRGMKIWIHITSFQYFGSYLCM